MGKSRSPDTRRQRLAEIAKELILKGEVSIKDLARTYDVSERMIRDDVDALINSVFGPAGRSKFRLFQESYHEQARKEFIRPKARVAACAVDLFKSIPYPSISMSPGTTVCLVAAMMVVKSRPADIISNSLSLCDVPMPESIKLTLTGGLYARATHSLVGKDSEQGFERFRNQVRVGVLGVSGVNKHGELFVHHSDEIPSLQAMLRSVSGHLFVVCDRSKLARVDPWRIADIESLVAGDGHFDTAHRRDPHDREGDAEPRGPRGHFRRKVTLVTNKPLEPSENPGTAAEPNERSPEKTLAELEQLKTTIAAKFAAQGGSFDIVEAGDEFDDDFDELRELLKAADEKGGEKATPAAGRAEETAAPERPRHRRPPRGTGAD
jgi:DeoR family transcriptional regulator, aga operon transcriptional repressor